MMSSPWFQRLSPQPEARARLFCFHHAGGSASAYRLWPKQLPDIDVCAVQLPGRANRFGEEAWPSLPALMDALLGEMLPLLDRPFAFFGHSMGTALAWGLARRLHDAGGPCPVQLFLSSRQTPDKPFPEESLRGMTDAQVLHRIGEQFGGFPPEALEHPELLELMLPALRADFDALQDWTPTLGDPLPVPITVLGGLSDPCSSRERLAAWQACSRASLRWSLHPGNHFFLDDEVAAVTAEVRHTLAEALDPAAGRRAA